MTESIRNRIHCDYQLHKNKQKYTLYYNNDYPHQEGEKICTGV